MQKIYSDIKNYYAQRIQEFGTTPRGVDWKDYDTQQIRFSQISKIIDNKTNFRINDLGCGYGAYLEFLNRQGYSNFRFNGYDLSKEMIDNALKQFKKKSDVTFRQIKSTDEMEEADFTVASGVFNVKMHYKEHEWLAMVLETIHNMANKSKLGFSFNILTKYSDQEYMDNKLYYADPLFFFDYCKRNYSKNVALLHDYDLFEFTILVKKS
ncbi:trans-aconitate 2-methyltransferase [Salinivirga cyanobacteriivorans]|uniref:Trans-aconitate 2-methyltransferase n=1 Tax=Salinivirga cyanobacteriivorans TaxID=1307839 RepID=A0A0S2HZN6_9BACT|nr:class I SAM-dependent methyltransferase [Salinivirga cyanobacteriivorans]ALO15609.1 trans-aconitate 2-methyltransferase [Salinivirga cyanobacteriivorans]